ncbi:MAG TPA: PEPxxWA-CTERM sorting domain-containing protein [Caulobacteraceae bacterium]|jgi:hypothetical protein|nr:PEPxxWA-CTERM sorting domain-containing protein [Caulobacteraceae bacterium]
MMFRLLAAAGAVVAVLAAPAAEATQLLFSFVETGEGALSWSYQQPSNPTPLTFANTEYTDIAVSDWTGADAPESRMLYWAGGGFVDEQDSLYSASPQIFSGTEKNPVFAPGSFAFTDGADGLDGTLTITATPEPAGWALMIVGVGFTGAALRVRRRRAPAGA